jgi:hypothetical protein
MYRIKATFVEYEHPSFTQAPFETILYPYRTKKGVGAELLPASKPGWGEVRGATPFTLVYSN